MIPLAAFALAGCLAVGASGDRILAGDLAAGFPEWAAVPPETPLGLAPAPGVVRVFRLPELRRLAERWNLSRVPDRDLCVTWPVAALTAVRPQSRLSAGGGRQGAGRLGARHRRARSQKRPGAHCRDGSRENAAGSSRLWVDRKSTR